MRETRWMRFYSAGQNRVRGESRFSSEGLQVSAESITSEWGRFSLNEKIEFSHAYSAKPSLTAEDEKILNFLMAVGPWQVWMNLALLLIRHPDRENVFRFLVTRVEGEKDHRANYYRSLEILGDPRAIPVLERQYEAYRTNEAFLKRGPLTRTDSSQLFDYLYCCRALLSLEGSLRYETAIKEMLNHSNALLSSAAKRLLSAAPE